MPENENDPGDKKLLILPLGGESRRITQVISNDTARQIIELLVDAPLSASGIAERLKAPLTTITYNLENLESVGLVKVERIKYSEKGREVKIYAPVRKLILKHLFPLQCLQPKFNPYQPRYPRQSFLRQHQYMHGVLMLLQRLSLYSLQHWITVQQARQHQISSQT